MSKMVGLGLTAAQWSLINLLSTVAIRGLKLAMKAMENVKKVEGMSPEELDDAIKKEEARSEQLKERLDES
jgi:hypothetical protein